MRNLLITYMKLAGSTETDSDTNSARQVIFINTFPMNGNFLKHFFENKLWSVEKSEKGLA